MDGMAAWHELDISALKSRMDDAEEKLSALSQMMDIMLRAVGLVDENGAWIDLEGDDEPDVR